LLSGSDLKGNGVYLWGRAEELVHVLTALECGRPFAPDRRAPVRVENLLTTSD